MRVVMVLALSLCLLAGMVSAGWGAPVKLADGTVVKVKLLVSLTSGKAHEGEVVPFSVIENVLGPDGVVLVEKGARATGKVTVSKRRGMLGKSGKLEFTIDSVTAIDGSQVVLRAVKEARGKNNSGAAITAAAILFLPAIFINGRDVTVKEGTEFPAYTDGVSSVDPARAVGATPGTPAVVVMPSAKFTVVNTLVAGTNVIGELQNDGPDAAGAEVIVTISADDKLVGAGTVTLGRVPVGKKLAFSIPINGKTEGKLADQVTVKVPTPQVFNLKVVTSLLAGTNVVGEVQNDGDEDAGVTLTVTITKDGKAVGQGTGEVLVVAAGAKVAFTVPVQGKTDGELKVDATGKSTPAPPPVIPAKPAN